MAEQEIPNQAVVMGQDVCNEAIVAAADLVMRSAAVAWPEAGWNGTASLACNSLFRVLLHQQDVEASHLAEGIASGIANAFPQLPPEKLRDFLTLVEERALVQMRGMGALLSGAAKLDG